MVDLEKTLATITLEDITREQLLEAKRDGISDSYLARCWDVDADERAREAQSDWA